MRIIMNIAGVAAAVFCIYYQTIVFIFINLNQSSFHPNPNYSLDTLAQLLTILICLIFLFLNIKNLFSQPLKSPVIHTRQGFVDKLSCKNLPEN